MQKTSHSVGIIPLSVSKLLERLAYYGMRSILVLYMVNELTFEHHSTSSIYGIFILAAGVIPVIGGLIGDLLLSTKLTAIIGGFIQALGFFILAIPAQIGLYLGLLLIALGTGLYSPNILSTISTLYKNRLERLDAAMLIFYLAINIGAFLGSYIIGITTNYVGYKMGFVVCGIIMLGSQLTLLLSNSLLKDASKTPNLYIEDENKRSSDASSVIIIIATILFVSIFWCIYELSNNPIFDRLSEIESFFQSFYSTYYALSTFSLIFVGIILVLIYSFVKASSLLKMAIGFVIYALSCAIIGVYCQREISSGFMVIILSAVFLQSIAELFISPTALSIICRYGSTKFKSTLLGAQLAASALFSYFLSSLLVNARYLGPSVIMFISIGTLIFFAAIFLVLYLVTKEKKNY